MSIDGKINVGETQVTKFSSNQPVKSTLADSQSLVKQALSNINILLDVGESVCCLSVIYMVGHNYAIAKWQSCATMQYFGIKISRTKSEMILHAMSLNLSTLLQFTVQCPYYVMPVSVTCKMMLMGSIRITSIHEIYFIEPGVKVNDQCYQKVLVIQ